MTPISMQMILGLNLGYVHCIPKLLLRRGFSRGFLVVTLTVALAGPVPAVLYAFTAKWYSALPCKSLIFADV